MAYKDQKSLKDIEEERKSSRPPEGHLIESRTILRDALLDIIATGSKNPKNLPATHMTHLAVNALKRDPLSVDKPNTGI